MAKAMPVAMTYERASLNASLNRREITGSDAARAGRPAEGNPDEAPERIKKAFSWTMNSGRG